MITFLISIAFNTRTQNSRSGYVTFENISHEEGYAISFSRPSHLFSQSNAKNFHFVTIQAIM